MGVYFGEQGVDDFTVKIYVDENGSPGGEEASITIGDPGRKDTGMTLTYANNEEIFEYSTYINPIELDAGTTYWLSIFNATDDWGWMPSTKSAGSAAMFAVPPYEDWDVKSGVRDLAFNLTKVPTPPVLPMVGLGLAILVVMRRTVRTV